MALVLTARGKRLAVTVLTSTALVMFLGGSAFLAYPFYTDYLAAQDQKRLAESFASSKLKIAYQSKAVAQRSPLTRLTIPRLGVDTIVVEGVSKTALDTGAGHYPTTPLPGEAGNVAIAGHRNTYGKPFAELDKLKPGDEVILRTPIATYTYRMVSGFDEHPNPWVTTPQDLSVLEPTPEPSLTLTTCHPRGSARQRLIARLELTNSAETGAETAA